jgi:transcriptional regulator with XRE-family HTH domain
MNIGQAIVAIRKKKHIKQKMLAENMGMSTNALVALEKGRAWPSAATMSRLSAALDVPQSFILLYAIGDDDIPEAKKVFVKSLLEPLKDYLI